jgi:3-hydroxyacyl-CoA dehydrogenase
MGEIRKTAVIGAGAMGHGIAQVFAHSGLRVALCDIDEKILNQAKEHIASNLSFLAKHNVIEESSIGKTLAAISLHQNMEEAISDVDFLIEAVPEDPDLKCKIFSTAEGHCPRDTILTTTTSVIQVNDIAQGCKSPNRIVGTHWMNPPFVLPLVEIVKGPSTSEEIVKTVKIFLEEQCGKRTVICKDTPGFLVNRMMAAVLVEASKMIAEGLGTFEDIDRAWKEHLGVIFLEFGPFGNIDHIGLDVVNLAANYLAFTLEDERYRPPEWLLEKVNNGDLGTKSGKGIYDYGGKSAEDMRLERVEKLLKLLQSRDYE